MSYICGLNVITTLLLLVEQLAPRTPDMKVANTADSLLEDPDDMVCAWLLVVWVEGPVFGAMMDDNAITGPWLAKLGVWLCGANIYPASEGVFYQSYFFVWWILKQ